MNWILAFALLAVVGFLLDREIYFYEGTHLGPRLQAWLYDRWSRKYDEGKRASQLQDNEMLAQPLLDALRNVPDPFILDFATGTGRLSYALLDRTEFHGRIVALDLSQGMLEQAVAKIKGAWQERGAMQPITGRQIEFLRHLSLPLPFPDAAFDVVCALEVLELFPGMNAPLAELTRVLRPGGVLLTSRGTEESGRRAKVKDSEEFTLLLEKNELEQVRITKWWKLFDRVIALKRGSSPPGMFRDLSQVLKCSSCGSMDWSQASSRWICRHCGKNLSRTPEGIILN
jgi:ubiquinone/menaquinone biosynthesis C-methylase UbiE